MSIPCRGIGVVARNGLHELVLFLAFSRILDTSAGVRAIKDADSINGGLAVLHVLGSRHGIVSDLRIKLVVARWLAVGKEHNDLLGICATRSDALCQLQTIIGARGAGGFDCLNCFPKISHAGARAIGQARHYLGVVVSISSAIFPFIVRVVADLIGLITRKLNNGNPVLPIDTLDTLVLLGDGINKAIGSVLQSCNALSVVSIAHSVIHRARGIQHHHDVKRRGDRHG